MSKERLEEAKKLIKHYHEQKRSNNVLLTERGVELIEHLYEQAERVQELESFKNSVEYTVDSETLELIINNQDNDKVLSLSETYDEKIYLLQKRVQELEDAVESYKKTSKHANISHKMAEEQNKRYREALEFYADEENYLFDEKEYKVGLGVPESEITLDYGNKAREALEDEEWVKNGWKKLS